MTDEFKEYLKAKGFSPTQVESKTAQMMVDLLMNEDCKILVAEATNTVNEMKEQYLYIQSQYNNVLRKFNLLSDLIMEVKDAQEKYGTVTDEKGYTILAMFSAMLCMCEKTDATTDKSLESISHILFAYLGGQARGNVNN